jgi:hypothetical protein
VRKKPSEERGPKLIMAIKQPLITTTKGVRQPALAYGFPVAACTVIVGLSRPYRSSRTI